TYTDTRALSNTGTRELEDHFVCQRSRSAHETDVARRADAAGNDAHLRMPGGNKSGAVRAEESRAALLHERIDARHVEHRYAFGDGHDEPNAGVGGFHDGIGGVERRNVNHGSVRARRRDRVRDGVEDRNTGVEGLPALARRNTGDDARAVLDHLPRVE